MREVFENIYRHHLWGGTDRSGTGSGPEETELIRRELPRLFDKLGVESIADIPCGTANWFLSIDAPGIRYIGADIVPEIIKDNRDKFDEDVDFRVLDITQDKLPKVDLIFVRDCLGHLSNSNVKKAVDNLWITQPEYLVATHWPGVVGGSQDITDGSWRPINMSNFLDEDKFELIDLIEEDIKDKYLGVWQLKQNSKQK